MVFRFLSEWHSEGFSTPIVMMSGHAEPSDIVKAMKLGATDFLKKPLHDFFANFEKYNDSFITRKINSRG